nr:hypothetical protein [Paenibacillus xylanexedens]
MDKGKTEEEWFEIQSSIRELLSKMDEIKDYKNDKGKTVIESKSLKSAIKKLLSHLSPNEVLSIRLTGNEFEKESRNL